MIELVRDLQYGASRIFFLHPLERSRQPRARATIDALADDPDLKLEVAHILKQRERKARRRKR
jgi:hypothetical protein